MEVRRTRKIKVTGEVCSYEPYGGNAVTIDTTDLSFTMPSSKVTLKAHTKDDYGYCSICGRTDLAEAYKKATFISKVWKVVPTMAIRR